MLNVFFLRFFFSLSPRTRKNLVSSRRTLCRRHRVVAEYTRYNIRRVHIQKQSGRKDVYTHRYIGKISAALYRRVHRGYIARSRYTP